MPASARARAGSVCFLLAAGMIAPVQAADDVSVRAGRHPGYGRLVFEWPQPVAVRAERAGQMLNLTFGRPVDLVDLSPLLGKLEGYVRGFAPGEGLDQLILQLEPGAQGNVVSMDQRIVIDFYSPHAGPPLLPVRVGRHGEVVRLVFDWRRRVPFRIATYDGVVGIEFEAPAQIAAEPIAQALQPLISDARAETEGDHARLLLRAPPEVQARAHALADHRILLDLSFPRAQSAALSIR